MKIAVIGLGATGCSAARFLARDGHEVTGYEQFRIGHERASSHGESRIFRYTYPDPFYTRLMREAYPLWRELEDEAGEPLLERCGGLFIGPRGHAELEQIERSLGEGRHNYEVLDAAETRARFPAFRLGREEVAIFQAESGFLRATSCVLATARLAREHGARLLENTPVSEVRCERGRAWIRARGNAAADATGREEREFDAAIVTAGPRMSRLLPGSGLPLRVTRQEIVYLRIARNAAHFEPDRFPVWIDADTYDYGFPSDGRIPGVKLGLHQRGESTDPDIVRLGVDVGFVRDRIACAASRLPDLSAEVTHAQVCLYTNTPDEDFIIDRAAGMPNVWIVSGCSGHGFKFTVLLGRIASDLATGGAYPFDLSRFSLARFS
jgi:monomeric sarcosine oxidase